MKKVFLLIVLTIPVIIQSCNSLEDPISELQTLEEVNSILTDNGSKTWRISEAKIIMGEDSINISNNFNVIDDEIILTKDGSEITLAWRRGFEIKIDATNSWESLSDNYLSVLEYSLNFHEIKSELSSINKEIEINVNAVGSVSLTFSKSGMANMLFLELVEKQDYDYATPKENLEFNTELTIERNKLSVRLPGPGMIGSHVENSLFIANREVDFIGGSHERVMKFNLTNGIRSQYSFYKTDFVSKELAFVDNSLIVVGGQYINTYGLNISNDPTSFFHGKLLSRFGVASLDSDIYIIGGDFNNIESEKIFVWNSDSQMLDEFTNMPEPRSGAKATVVNDNLYVFGGTEEFFGNPAKNSVYIISLSNPSEISTVLMDRELNFTFVSKYQNLIYVAGMIINYDDNGSIIGYDFTIGVFNTLDNSFKKLSHNLPNASSNFLIHQMVIINDKLYVLYGDFTEDWSIMSAIIN